LKSEEEEEEEEGIATVRSLGSTASKA